MIDRRAHPLESVVRNGHHALMTALSAAGRALAALLGVAAILLAGCHSPSSWTAHTATTATYPPMPATGVIDGPFPVVRVIDGDTIVVEIDGTPTTIRLIGIDTPELVDPRKPVQCFSREASEYTKAMLTGQSVYLEYDPTQDRIDRYGRGLAYVWTTAERLVNLDLIAGGYANEYTFNTPYRYQAEFQAAEFAAADEARGLWSPDTCPA
uniref:thermonuclease family protein n=1 Tax=Mycolicibacterium obuense TaxID=1807 RepID=UPI003F583E50